MRNIRPTTSILDILCSNWSVVDLENEMLVDLEKRGSADLENGGLADLEMGGLIELRNFSSADRSLRRILHESAFDPETIEITKNYVQLEKKETCILLHQLVKNSREFFFCLGNKDQWNLLIKNEQWSYYV